MGAPHAVGRYALLDEIATGGMATVYFARLLGTAGFTRVVAVKRLHPQFAKDPLFAQRFVQEAQLAASVQHPNVVPTLDVVSQAGELFLVMEYVRGETLSRLLQGTVPMPHAIACAIVAGALYGLHAAHEAVDAEHRPLGIVHRDVSPQNILVGADGVPRVLDFGIAKATTTAVVTLEGQLRGKLRYMSPEQCLGSEVDRRSDIFSAGIVLWEALTGRDLFAGNDVAVLIRRVLEATVTPPSALVSGIPKALDAVVMRALERDRERRFQSAWDMAVALEEALSPATPRQVASFITERAREALSSRASLVAELERLTDSDLVKDAKGDKTQATIIQARVPVPMAKLEPPKRGRSGPIVVGAALLGLLLCATLFFALRQERPVPRATSEPNPEPSALGSAAVDPPAEALALPTLPAEESVQKAPARVRARTATRPSAPSSAKPVATIAADCNPPYTIDARGDKHYKRECL